MDTNEVLGWILPIAPLGPVNTGTVRKKELVARTWSSEGSRYDSRFVTSGLGPPLWRSQSQRGTRPSRECAPAPARGRAARRPGAMDRAVASARAHVQPPLPEAWPRVNSEEELYDCLDYYYLRDFPACGAGRSKGRSRRERELRTNWPVPGGHERKITQKLLNGQRKRRQRQLQPPPRTRLV